MQEVGENEQDEEDVMDEETIESDMEVGHEDGSDVYEVYEVEGEYETDEDEVTGGGE